MAGVAMHEGEVLAAGVVDVDDRCGRGWEVKTVVQETAEESPEEDRWELWGTVIIKADPPAVR